MSEQVTGSCSHGFTSAGFGIAITERAQPSAPASVILWVTLAIVLITSPAVHAEPAQRVHSLDTEPIAVRAGVLMVPLGADRHGDRWPQTVELALADGRRIEGIVAWIHSARPPIHRRWTDDPRGLAIRRIEPTDDTSVLGTGAPYLLARLPPDGDGPLRLREQTLRPMWHDPAGPIEPSAGQPRKRETLQIVEQPNRPDPHSPFEYWRWVLLAQRLDMDPPAPDAYGEVGSLVAEHYAGLWRLGLARLGAVSPGVAAQCRDLLTQTCLDQQQPFAAWVTDPDEVGVLLSLLLDFTRPDRTLMETALGWADSQDLLLIWPGPGSDDRATVAIANPTYKPIVVKFTWLAADEIPVAAQIEPGVLTRVHLDRPASPRPAGAEPPQRADVAQQVLLVEAAGRRQRVTFRHGALTARPPGVFFGPLRPPLTLAEVQTRRHRPLGADRSTLVHVRKLNRRWEIFFECRRPMQSAATPSEQADLAARAGYEDTRGIEAVTLLLGGDPVTDGPTVALTVPEHGWHRLFRGRSDDSLQVHRRSFADRWCCRIVLPESWLHTPPGGEMRIGLLRTHGDSDAAETAPYATVAWRLNPGRAPINLTMWDGLPDQPSP